MVPGDLLQAPGDGARALKRRRKVHVRDVSRDELVEGDVLPGEDRHGGDDHDRAEHALQLRAAAGAADALHQHAGPRARARAAPAPTPPSTRARSRPTGPTLPDGDHGSEDGAGAGGVEEAERAADEESRQESVAGVLGPETGDPRQRRLHARGDVGDHQRQPEGEQDEDGEVAQRVVAEAHAADDVREPYDRDREGHRQSEDDPEWPASASDTARRQERWEHGQHARRKRRARPGEEREREQDDHGFCMWSPAGGEIVTRDGG